MSGQILQQEKTQSDLSARDCHLMDVNRPSWIHLKYLNTYIYICSRFQRLTFRLERVYPDLFFKTLVKACQDPGQSVYIYIYCIKKNPKYLGTKSLSLSHSASKPKNLLMLKESSPFWLKR